MAENHKITIGIVNFDGRSYLPGLRNAVRALRGPVGEVLIADDRSRDEGPSWISEHWPEARLLVMERRGGPGPCRNRLLREARNPWVLLLDNDALPREDCLLRLLEAREARPSACVVQARVLDKESGLVHYDGGGMHYAGVPIPRNLHVPLRQLRGEEAPSWIPSRTFQAVCLLVERGKVLDCDGGFDPAFFFYYEDSDLAHRLLLRGEEILGAPRALCDHLEGTKGLSQRGRAYPVRRLRLHARNRVWLLVKCWRLRTLVLALPGILLYDLAFFVLACLRGHPLAWCLGKLEALRGLPRVLAARRAVQRDRRRRDRDLLSADPIPFLPQFRKGPAAFPLRVLNGLLRFWWVLVRPFAG